MLRTDASGVGVAAVLLQENEGKLYPVGYAGACPGFLKGGVQYLLDLIKRSSDFNRGVQWSDHSDLGGPVH